ncbi:MULTISPECIES: hypothetical protein [Halomonas]|uniref:Uncharacterized protein n=2 Tax=Halomonas TaxID=2745 RepID=A0ABQ0U7B7_9GAMM|nr:MULTISPECIES: hypothetical protein [Halomonas]PSJ23152.1 hypothetical protein CVH10_04525 [Halomonas sp. ND22Bw]KGE77801.1 hypothetical protein FP66_07885 [Halomonas salina]MDR5890071.1 hypothetical protein [Halomonas salina]RAH38776.1 hypothetical protein C9J49_003795 [Halomonas sp. SL1]WJY06668.1 hypothetical protein QWG60_13285 [Halomonas halophila]
MAGGFQRGNRRRTPKLEARGELQSVEREGPFKEWLGMPDLYRYQLVVDGEDYSYQTEDSELPVAVGDRVVFRYKETKAGKWVDRNSLGKAIDPADYQ